MEEVTPTPRFDARDYLRIISRRKWFIIVIGAVAMLLGGIYAATYQTEYRASSVVWIRQQPERFFWTEQGRGGDGQQISLETQAALARSIPNATKTAERLAARASGYRVIVNATQIVDSISIQVMPPDRMRIQAVHPIEQYAIAFANETAETFVETSADLRRTEDQAAVKFLEDQLEVAQNEIEQASDEKQLLQRKWGVSNPQASETLLTALEQYKQSLSVAQADLAATNARIATLRREYEGAEGAKAQELLVPNPLHASLQQELYTTRLALIKLQTRYTSDHPTIQQLTAQVSELRNHIEHEPAAITATVVTAPEERQETKSMLNAAVLQAADLQGRIRVLQGLISSTESQSLDLMEKEVSLTQLEDKATLARSTYEGLLQALRDTRLKEAAKQGTARILDRAIKAQEIKPSWGRAMIFAGMLGVFAGVMLALFLEALDDTIHSPEDILRDTTVAFLGIAPWTEQDPERLVALATPKSPPAEAFRTLRSNINFALVDQPAHSFLVTSAGAGEGKTLTAANLAVVLAQAGQSVVLVDSDLRRPFLHRIFDCDSTMGLTNILVGELPLPQALQDTGVENLKLIPSGPLPPNPAELLDSAAMQAFINQVSQQADIIIYDSPPCIMLTDAIVLSAKIERTILVAEAGQVTRDAFNEMVRLITNARGNILGAVLNKLKVTAGDYYYYYYYYYYYTYGPRTGEEEDTSVRSPIPPLQTNYRSGDTKDED